MSDMVDELKLRVMTRAKTIMEARGIGLRTLARETGLSYGQLRRGLSDRDRGTTTGTILLISQALGVDPHDLTAPL